MSYVRFSIYVNWNSFYFIFAINIAYYNNSKVSHATNLYFHLHSKQGKKKLIPQQDKIFFLYKSHGILVGNIDTNLNHVAVTENTANTKIG